MKKTAVTLVEVAKKAGVAVMTASRALSGEGYVSEETKAKVLAAAGELGYATNMLARVMKGGRTNVIGVVVNDLASVVITAYIAELSAEVRRYQMDLFIYNAVDDLTPANGRRLDQLLHGLWDGLIYVMPRMSDEYLAMLEQSERPIVLMNYCKRSTALPVVNGDNFNGARDATRHLVDLGHRRIAFIRGSAYTGQSVERERGYRAALDDAGIAFDPALVQQGDFSERSGTEATERLLVLPERPSAIFCANDEMGFGSMVAIQGAGLSVPGDISLVGFDDVAVASIVQPRMTTLRHPTAAMAKAAVQELLRRIQDQPGRRQRVEFPSEFVVRESSAQAPAAAPVRRASGRTRKTTV
ncbi:LacI family DNA-binding transcriptional regulator [Duganella sp. CT11-25]|uniref:LacI family DNA-binding transcriptional regulator n=1 Tax=unclassified Duganella TaxID=2636909 RepID=UPI0039B079D5